MDMKQRKRELRKEVKAAIASLDPGYCREADGKIAASILALPEYQRAKTVFCFVSTDTEINTAPIIEDAWRQGKRVGVPRVEKMGIMHVYEIRSWEDLEDGFYGIREPGKAAPLIQPEELDFVVMPCLCCGHDGRRLGYGGGFYDRYMERLSTPRAVICREKIMRDDIPVDVHDLMVEMVISEDGVRRLK